MVNEVLAEHYGITGVFTPRFVRVAAPNDRGGGVLAQAAVMLAQSNGQDAHAVNRGVWIRSRLLGDPPSEPPPDVASLPEPSSDAKAQGPSVYQAKIGFAPQDRHNMLRLPQGY